MRRAESRAGGVQGPEGGRLEFRAARHSCRGGRLRRLAGAGPRDAGGAGEALFRPAAGPDRP
eukprot:8176124-Lingulodinium_polyedra.AAC.1